MHGQQNIKIIVQFHSFLSRCGSYCIRSAKQSRLEETKIQFWDIEWAFTFI